VTRGARRTGSARTIAVQSGPFDAPAMTDGPAATRRRTGYDAVHASCSPIL